MRAISCVILLASLCACANQPLTRYYTLSADDLAQHSKQNSANQLPAGLSLGIGPISLPSMLDRNGIVSQLNDGPQINVAGLDVWAGNLDVLLSRTIAESMAQHLNLPEVWSIPWDNALRPDYQLRLFVEKFSGELGGPVTIKIKWVLLTDHGKRPIGIHIFEKTQSVTADDYASYVQTLNQLLADFTADAAQVTAHTIKGAEIYPPK